MSFMIGCGFTKPRFEKDTSISGVSAYLLDLTPSQQIRISKDEIKNLLTPKELEDTYSKYVYIYFALNYRFFSENSTLWWEDVGATTSSKIISHVWKNNDKFYTYNRGKTTLITGNISAMTFQYPYEVANGVLPTMILDASLYTPLGIRDRLVFKLNRETLLDTNTNFNLIFRRGNNGLDNYTEAKGNGALFGNAYFVGEVLSKAFTVLAGNRDKEVVLGKWDDSLINKKASITFIGRSPTLLETFIKEEQAPSTALYEDSSLKRTREATLFKKEDKFVCLMKTNVTRGTSYSTEDTEVMEIRIIG